MQLLIDKFNEILGNEFYVHNINNTKEVKESVVEGILKTYGGSIVAGANNSYVNQVIDINITFAVPCDDNVYRDRIVTRINSLIEATNGQEYNFENDNRHYIVYWSRLNDSGAVYVQGLKKMVSIAISGQVAVTNALLTSNGLKIKIGSTSAGLFNLTGVMEFIPSVTNDYSKDYNLSNGNSKLNFNGSSTTIKLKGYVLNDLANKILLRAFKGNDLSVYVDAEWSKGDTVLLKIDKQRFKIHTYTPIFVNNNYAVYECYLGESDE